MRVALLAGPRWPGVPQTTLWTHNGPLSWLRPFGAKNETGFAEKISLIVLHESQGIKIFKEEVVTHGRVSVVQNLRGLIRTVNDYTCCQVAPCRWCLDCRVLPYLILFSPSVFIFRRSCFLLFLSVYPTSVPLFVIRGGCCFFNVLRWVSWLCFLPWFCAMFLLPLRILTQYFRVSVVLSFLALDANLGIY